MARIVGPTTGYNYPQYLMPVRHSVFRAWESTYPLYAEMHQLVNTSAPSLFRIAPSSKDWLASMKKKIRTQIFAAPACPTP